MFVVVGGTVVRALVYAIELTALLLLLRVCWSSSCDCAVWWLQHAQKHWARVLLDLGRWSGRIGLCDATRAAHAAAGVLAHTAAPPTPHVGLGVLHTRCI